jgi:hypothetical protein
MSSNRKNRNVTLDIGLYQKIKVLAAKQEKNANDLIEEGMELILIKYGEIEDPIKND